MIKNKNYIFVSCFAFLSIAFFAHASTFTLDLKTGSNNAEVLALQKILNTDTDTQVATEGPGSLSNETSYFGQKTQNAVKRFQEKYRSEILAPLNISAPTGVVGARTRAVLNSLAGGAGNPAGIEVNPSPLEYDYTKLFPTISSVYPSSVEDPQNQMVTIYGSNFTQNNKVFLSVQGLEIFSASSNDGNTLSVLLNTSYTNLIKDIINNIPENAEGTARKQALDLLKAEFNSTDKNGIYVPAVLFVQNENGESNKFKISINLFKDE